VVVAGPGRLTRIEIEREPPLRQLFQLGEEWPSESEARVWSGQGHCSEAQASLKLTAGSSRSWKVTPLWSGVLYRHPELRDTRRDRES